VTAERLIELRSTEAERRIPLRMDLLSSRERRSAVGLAARMSVGALRLVARRRADDRRLSRSTRVHVTAVRLSEPCSNGTDQGVGVHSRRDRGSVSGISAQKAVEERFGWSRAVAETIDRVWRCAGVPGWTVRVSEPCSNVAEWHVPAQADLLSRLERRSALSQCWAQSSGSALGLVATFAEATAVHREVGCP
jgi:hypothetical protein